VLDLVSADGRRPVTEAERASILRFWGEVFAQTPTEDLRRAVVTWLQEHPRGRPNVGELQAILKRLTPESQKREEWSKGEQRAELVWAVSILEAPHRFQGPDYRHTLETAEHYLRKWRFSSWQEAKKFLIPGWSPTTVTEVYL